MLWRIDITDIDHELALSDGSINISVDLTIWFDGPAHPHGAPESFNPAKGLGSLWDGWLPKAHEPVLESTCCRVAAQVMEKDRRVRRVHVRVTRPSGFGGHDISIGLDVTRSDLDMLVG